MQILEQFAASTRVIEGSALLIWSEEGTLEAQPLPKAGQWRVLLLPRGEAARIVEGRLGSGRG